MRRVIVLAVTCAALASVAAQEGPAGRALFERWARDTFFGGYKPTSPTQRWDVPASANRDHGGIPVTFKSARLGSPVDLGDALRQYEISEPFLLIIGFWEPDGERKRLVNLVACTVSENLWRKLWGRVTYADLQRFDALIKDTAPTVEEIRRRALAMKIAPPFTSAILQLVPKIDEQGQRRLLCSLRFQDAFTHLAPGADPRAQERPLLFGVEFPVGPTAAPRPPGQP